MTYQSSLVILEIFEPLVDGFSCRQRSEDEWRNELVYSKTRTFRSLEQASTTKQLAGRPTSARNRPRARRSGRKALVDARGRTSSTRSHGSTEVGGPAVGGTRGWRRAGWHERHDCDKKLGVNGYRNRKETTSSRVRVD